MSNRPRRRKSSIIRTVTLKGSINDIRKEPIPFDKDVNILALEQSIGKTERCIEYIKQHYKNKWILYLTNKHIKLNEVEEKLKDAKINFRHWYGFEKGCPQFNIKKGLYNKHVSPSTICFICNQNKICTYLDQFKNLPNVVLAPTQYIGTKYVDDFSPDIIFIDESINNFKDYTRVKKYKRQRHQSGTLKKIILYFIVDDIKKGNNIDVWIEMLNDIEFAEKFPNFIHDKAWYPLIYYVFQRSETTPIVLMDATFEISLFKYLLKRYIKEKNRRFKPSIKVWYSEVENTNNSTIFVPFPGRGFFKKHFWGYNYRTREILEQIKKQMIKSSIDPAFITYEGFLDYFPPFKTNHFGAISGLNEFEDCDVLVIAGTYRYGEKGTEVVRMIFNDPSLDVPLGESKGKNKPWIPYKTITVNGKKYPNYPILQAENDQWDALMRIRPYKYRKQKQIILLGYIAERFKNKLNYNDKLNLDDTLKEIEKIYASRGQGIDLLKTWDLILEVSKGKGPSTIAKNYKIHKTDGGYDTDFVRKMKEKLPKLKP